MIKLGMFRSLLIASVCIGSACDVGSVLPQQSQTDGGGGGDSGGGGDAAGEAACPALGSTTIDGHHTANNVNNEGPTIVAKDEGCMGQAACHNANETPAPGDIWVYGGEAFQDPNGTTPYAGATIMLTVAGSPPQTATMTIMNNGFFYMPQGGTFPVPSATQSISVAICVGTNKLTMATPLAAAELGSGTDGNCSSSTACHNDNKALGAGGYIYLPPM